MYHIPTYYIRLFFSKIVISRSLIGLCDVKANFFTLYISRDLRQVVSTNEIA